MALEIERKFLVGGDSWRAQATRTQHMLQGYLIDASIVTTGAVRCSVRVRIAGDKAWLNIKSAQLGVARQEFEYPIPRDDAAGMLRDFCDGVVEKYRHYVPVDGDTFEVDEFLGLNTGLVVAELELASPQQAVPRPDWLGREVTELARYYNLNLLQHPYARWSAHEKTGVD